MPKNLAWRLQLAAAQHTAQRRPLPEASAAVISRLPHTVSRGGWIIGSGPVRRNACAMPTWHTGTDRHPHSRPPLIGFYCNCGHSDLIGCAAGGVEAIVTARL